LLSIPSIAVSREAGVRDDPMLSDAVQRVVEDEQPGAG
jgi:hypothetical protein